MHIKEVDMLSVSISDALLQLLSFIGDPQAIRSTKFAISLSVQLPPTDLAAQKFFKKLHLVWPLWAHFLAHDGSVEYVIRALNIITPDEIEQFLACSQQALDETYRTLSVDLNSRTTTEEVRSYLVSVGLLPDFCRSAPSIAGQSHSDF